MAEYALQKLGIDKIGLDVMDRKILEIIIDKVRSNRNFLNLFYNSFNKKSAILAAIIIVFLASPAPYIKMLAVIIDYVYNIGFINSILIGLSIIHI